MFYFSFSCASLFQRKRLLTGFNFSVKLFVFLFCILPCYLLNMSSFSICSIFFLFHCSTFVRCFVKFLSFHRCSIVPPMIRCSSGVSLFPRCSLFRSSVVPYSVALGFIACLDKWNRKHERYFSSYWSLLKFT